MSSNSNSGSSWKNEGSIVTSNTTMAAKVFSETNGKHEMIVRPIAFGENK